VRGLSVKEKKIANIVGDAKSWEHGAYDVR
jgi:hypothetical protein